MGKVTARCPAGSASWGEIRRWRSWGGCWVFVRVQTPGTVPVFLLLLGSGVEDRSSTPSYLVPEKRTGALSLRLAWVMLLPCVIWVKPTRRSGQRCASGMSKLPGSSAHHRAAELEPQHWGLDVPPG